MTAEIPLFGDEGRIPTIVGGLLHVGTEVYEDSRMGVKLRYVSPVSPDTVKADIYAYDFGLPSIPEDITSPEVEEFFQASCGEVLGLAEQGLYLDLEIRESRYLHIPEDASEPSFLWALFYLRHSADPDTNYEGFRFSHLELRTDHGYITKIRLTYPAASDEDWSSIPRVLFLDWLRLMEQLDPRQ